MRECLALHRTPLEQLSAENCRMMLEQKFNPQFLVPLALRFLDDFPIHESDSPPTALLQSVLNLPWEFWEQHQNLWFEVCGITARVRRLHDEIEQVLPQIEKFERAQM